MTIFSRISPRWAVFAVFFLVSLSTSILIVSPGGPAAVKGTKNPQRLDASSMTDFSQILGGPNSIEVCGSLGGSWSNASDTCTLAPFLVGSQNWTISFSVPQGEVLQVALGASLVIAQGVDNLSANFGNNGIIYNYGTIRSLTGTSLGNVGVIDNNGTIEADSLFENNGLINNNGTLTVNNSLGEDNSGTINNYHLGLINFLTLVKAEGSQEDTVFQNYAFINNNGTIINDGSCGAGGGLDNSYFIFNRGTINNERCGSINNGYSIAYRGVGKIVNYAMINNYGSLFTDPLCFFEIGMYCGIDNYGPNSAIKNYNGTISNGGFIDNYNGTIANYGQGTMVNSGGTINNWEDGTIANYQHGTIVNNGGTINNWNGTIDINDAHGNFSIFGGFIRNGGSINNRGIIKIYPTITLSGYDPVTGPWNITEKNDGAIENEQGGIIHSNGTIENSWIIGNRGTLLNAGTLNNNGTIYEDLSGNFTNSDGAKFNNYGNVRNCPFSIFTNPQDGSTLGTCQAGFMLAVKPTTISIQPGSTASLTITLFPNPLYPRSLPPFSGNVTLTTYNIYNQTGIMTNFNHPTISSSPGSNSTLTIDVVDSVVSWTYYIQIIGTSGSQNSSVWITVGVSPQQILRSDLNVIPEWSRIAGARWNGGQVVANVSIPISVPFTLTPINGFDKLVNFTIIYSQSSEGLLSCTFDHPIILVSLSPATIHLSCIAPTAGDFTITVEGVGPVVDSVSEQFFYSDIVFHIVSAAPTRSPVATSPLNLGILYVPMVGLAIVAVVVALAARKGKHRD